MTARRSRPSAEWTWHAVRQPPPRARGRGRALALATAAIYLAGFYAYLLPRPREPVWQFWFAVAYLGPPLYLIWAADDPALDPELSPLLSVAGWLLMLAPAALILLLATDPGSIR